MEMAKENFGYQMTSEILLFRFLRKKKKKCINGREGYVVRGSGGSAAVCRFVFNSFAVTLWLALLFRSSKTLFSTCQNGDRKTENDIIDTRALAI